MEKIEFKVNGKVHYIDVRGWKAQCKFEEERKRLWASQFFMK